MCAFNAVSGNMQYTHTFSSSRFYSLVVCAGFGACVRSCLAGAFLEGNKSICYKKAARDLTAGTCCSLPLSAKRARDIARLGERERERERWNRVVGRRMNRGSERCQDRGR